MEAKRPKDSFTTMTELVMPNDTNPLHNLMGGNLLKWMDIAAGISANRHAQSMVVTVSVDNVSFKKAIKLGDIVTIHATVTRAFTTSMEVHLEVFAQDFIKGIREKANDAFFTFVAIGEDGTPCEVPPIAPETEEEKKLYESAKRRRDMRLILGGKMKPRDSAELTSLFLDKPKPE